MFAFALLMAATAPAHPADVAAAPHLHHVSHRRPSRKSLASRQFHARLVLNPISRCAVDPTSSACHASTENRYGVNGAPSAGLAFDPKTHATQVYDQSRTCGLIGATPCPAKGMKLLRVGLNAPE